jgi:hypothetical protein
VSSFSDYLLEVLGGTSTISPSTTSMSEIEGKRIARDLGAKFLGISDGLLWLNDNRTDSSYVAKDFQTALQKRSELWKKFGYTAPNN